jgi:enoyl-CoA hydratase/carnithine racemase
MAYSFLKLDMQGAIAVITLNRPERRNALSLSLMRELTACLEEIGLNHAVQVIILASEGKVFSSGHDLNEMIGRSIGDYREIFDACCQLMLKLRDIPQPVIAEVQGMATAAGCQLVAACDLAIASEAAQFATPGVKIGLFCTTPMVELCRAIGRKRALHMLLTGEPISAKTAIEWGLVNNVVPISELRETTRLLASHIAAASPLTVSIGKQAYYAQIDLDHEKAYAYAKEVMTMNARADDAQEGITAFLEKRAASWSGQ